MRSLAAVAFSLIASLSLSSSAEVVALRGARLIDGTGRAPQQNAVLVVDGSRIVAIGPAAKVRFHKARA